MLINIPVACTGGVLALLVTRMNFSVSAAMGFISIFGIAIQDAILVVTYFQRLRDADGHSIEHAAREAAEKRFRPVLMTTLVATLGLLPAALSNGIGSQTQKPLAIVVIGGAADPGGPHALVQPPLLVVAHTWINPRGPADPEPPPPERKRGTLEPAAEETSAPAPPQGGVGGVGPPVRLAELEAMTPARLGQQVSRAPGDRPRFSA